VALPEWAPGCAAMMVRSSCKKLPTLGTDAYSEKVVSSFVGYHAVILTLRKNFRRHAVDVWQLHEIVGRHTLHTADDSRALLATGETTNRFFRNEEEHHKQHIANRGFLCDTAVATWPSLARQEGICFPFGASRTNSSASWHNQHSDGGYSFDMPCFHNSWIS